MSHPFPVASVLEDPRPFSDPEHPIHQPPKPIKPDAGFGITLTDHGTMIVDGIEMSVQFVKTFLTNADGKHLFAFKRAGNQMHMTQIANAQSAKDYFAANPYS